jgi:hypothetical protein
MPRFVAIVIAVVCAGVALALVFRERGVDCDGYRFDAAAWKRAHALGVGRTDAEPAHRLAEELVKCRVLVDRDKTQVERLLGRPVRSDSTRMRWHYDLGHLGGTFNYDSLVIDFVDGRRVSGVDIWEGG